MWLREGYTVPPYKKPYARYRDSGDQCPISVGPRQGVQPTVPYVAAVQHGAGSKNRFPTSYALHGSKLPRDDD